MTQDEKLLMLRTIDEKDRECSRLRAENRELTAMLETIGNASEAAHLFTVAALCKSVLKKYGRVK